MTKDKNTDKESKLVYRNDSIDWIIPKDEIRKKIKTSDYKKNEKSDKTN